ncbi:MAG: ParB/RepB/Spo0J family partition protein [Bacteroidales bacterium]|nr:ParB/RepB/Spo0J family partition protein [Candidatus Colimorpha merdihippi]MCQ2281653.1 ParB/RepB/Spo0J family partition protein [Bacteroidales bacterium]
MASKKPNIPGRGLDAILGNIDVDTLNGSESDVTASIGMIPISEIQANPFQPRKEFDETALQELAQSIREQGVITPITVRRMPDGKYQLIAGERRFRASQLAGLTEMPAYIRIATDGQMMEMALVENIQRENLNAMEVALSYNALVEECRLTHEQLSQRVGKDRSTITNYLRLLTLPSETQLALSSGQISMAHARALINIENPEQHLAILHSIVNRHLSVHQTEQLVKATKNEAKPKVAQKNDLPNTHSVAQSQMRQMLESEVEIKRSRRGKGTMTIHFNNDEDFDRIMKLLHR